MPVTGSEPGRWGLHIQGRVRPVMVIRMHPRIELRLSIGKIGEHLPGEELLTKRAMKPLNLSRRRWAPWRGQQVIGACRDFCVSRLWLMVS